MEIDGEGIDNTARVVTLATTMADPAATILPTQIAELKAALAAARAALGAERERVAELTAERDR